MLEREAFAYLFLSLAAVLAAGALLSGASLRHALTCFAGIHAAPYLVSGRESHAEATRRTRAKVCPRCERTIWRDVGEWFEPPRRNA